MRYYLCLLLSAATTEMESTRGCRYVITADEIKEASATTAYEAIQLLRPDLLNRDQRRAIDMYTVSEVYVYVEGTRYGQKESLKQIPATDIAEIKYLSSTEATVKFGSNHSGGACLIK